MDLGNVFEKLSEDSRTLLTTVSLCFPIAYLDCWKISLSFHEIDVIPQIILAIGVAMLLTLGGVLLNLLYIGFSGIIGARISSFVSLLPTFVASIYILLSNATLIIFVGFYLSWCLVAVGQAFYVRAIKERKCKKGRDKQSDN